MKKKTDWCKQNVHDIITNNYGITWCIKCGLLITEQKKHSDNFISELTNMELEDRKKIIRKKLEI